MKYIKTSTGGVVITVIQPSSQWIDEANNKSFVNQGHIEVNQSISDNDLLLKKYDDSAETEDIKTLDSFTSPGVDSQNKPRWFDWDSGVLMQHTYDSNNQITGEEEVT
jgi:hypothetical protein